MKAAVWTGAEKMELWEIPRPKLEASEVLVKTRATVVCGTDLHIYRGLFRGLKPPRVLGHEFSGEVVATGNSVTKTRVGDRVTVDPVLSCGECRFCRTGHTILCERGDLVNVIGFMRDGAYAEYVSVPEENAYPMPSSLTYEKGAFVNTLACPLYALRRVGVRKGDFVVVLGSGAAGLFFVQLAKLMGAGTVVSTDLSPSKLELATRLGADAGINVQEKDPVEEVMNMTSGRGADIVIEAVGAAQTAQQVVPLAAKQGKVIIFGVFETPVNEIPFEDVRAKDLEIYGIAGYATPIYPEAISLLASSKLEVEAMITHRFRLEEVPTAFHQINRRIKPFGKALVVQ